MRNKRIKFVLATAMLCLLVFSLTACGLFLKYKTIDLVSISVTDGLTEDAINEGYIATLGSEFNLLLSWTEGATPTPVIEWFIAKDKEAPIKIEGETKKILTYKFTEFSPSVYTFFAIVNNVKSNLLVKVALQYATLDKVEITSPNALIVQDVIQQDLAKLKAVDFVVNFDATNFAPEYSKKISIKWLVDGVETGISTKTFSYQPTAIKAENHIIAVEVLVEGSSIAIKDFVTIEIVEKFEAIQSVRLNLQGGATSNEKGYYTQFVEIANGTVIYKSVDLSLVVLPELGTNLQTNAVWKHRTESGTATLTNVGRTVSVMLKPGKNVFSAVIDNVESRELTVYALTENEYNIRKAVIDDTFIWNGNLQSFYIMDNYDLDCVVSKMVADRKIAATVTDKNCKRMYLQPASWKNGGSVSPEFSTGNEGSKKCVMQKSLDAVDESGKFTFSFNATSIYLTSQSFFGTPSGAYPTTVKVEQAKGLTNFSSSTVNRTALPIDLVTETLEVEDTNMLMRALSWGFKPIFASSPNGAATKAVYDKARAVLYDINDDNMTEFEKVRAIYQWITASVAYDYKVLEIPETDDETFKRTLNYNAFYLEGVFNDGQAVCDGKSKAFVLLCGMEGIKAMRLTGKADPKSTVPLSSLSEAGLDQLGNHAWNKVLVDTNGDGAREWYMVDTTWGDMGKKNSTTSYTEYTAMDYFLVNDNFTKNTHLANQKQPVANTDYDYYGKTTIIVGGSAISLNITSREQLKVVLNHSKNNGSVWIEVKNSYTTSGSGSDFASIVRSLTFGTGQIIPLNQAANIYLIKY